MSDLPTIPMRAGETTLSDLIDLYMAHYTGRDPTRLQRLGWWGARVGSKQLQELSDDDVHAALEALATQHSRYFAGKDADDQPIYRNAYFSPSWTPFQADRGRHFSVIVDGVSV